ncbi:MULTISPECIES: sialidase family protein [Chryseobacterium]|uniref:Neuraminidase n=1 Tax=Chryseobacterium camelliae TaxID=1265445 RepID=A0ABU0TI98_9FLAO|nr:MULTISPECIES: sialidase family protein [Chryseobacterium]MDT3409361.1 putative neuraminidase [Pseudacidovorax intermedius]MDQ1096774.1 putative neuraminidase [Chryseobacterium camelliae]MDQ1100717.1 putative neuraminidase [Chryseobacterium sp. SORGH_AS_1048]MDR6088056.1 putative neuraminidase [Chryseobacterium sp. SORGH_AS_0909]MDR6132430.1 putative neuraminidase [Chryseobacterium sp. SORGH_AS_1175]
MRTFISFLGCILLISCKNYQPVLVSREKIFTENTAGFRQCHASTLTETENGNIICSWFGGEHEGDRSVKIWLSEWNHQNWSVPKAVADGKGSGNTDYPAWNPVLYTLPKTDSVFMFYKAGPNPREWSCWLKTSADGGKNWSQPEELKSLIGPVKNRPLMLRNGDLVSPSSKEFTEKNWKVHLEWSTDRGKTWKVIPVNYQQKDVQVIQPSIIEHKNGVLQLLARSQQNKVMTSFSHDHGKQWTLWEETNLANPNSGTDAIRLKNNWLLMVYNPEISGKNWWEGRTKLNAAISKDGKQWKDVLVLENGKDGDEYSYPSVIQASDGKVHISYTWNRKSIVHAVIE